MGLFALARTTKTGGLRSSQWQGAPGHLSWPIPARFWSIPGSLCSGTWLADNHLRGYRQRSIPLMRLCPISSFRVTQSFMLRIPNMWPVIPRFLSSSSLLHESAYFYVSTINYKDLRRITIFFTLSLHSIILSMTVVGQIASCLILVILSSLLLILWNFLAHAL